jgi:hypothetical protein
MKVVNVCVNDYANFSHDNANALRSVGIDCEDYIAKPHALAYKEQSIVLGKNKIGEKTRHADIVQIMHSDFRLLPFIDKSKKLIVWHTGTRYRQSPKKMNQIFNPIVDKCILALGEFWGLGAKNQTYCIGAVDTDKLQPVYNEGKFVIAHYPSGSTDKGTANINKIISRLKKKHDFEYHTGERVPYKDQIERIKKCDIYIDVIANKQNGKPYGSWGITALEAASLGKVVYAAHTTKDIYEKHYGGCRVIKVDSVQGLYDRLDVMLYMKRKQLRILQKETREWAMNHSYKSTGEYLKNVLEPQRKRE